MSRFAGQTGHGHRAALGVLAILALLGLSSAAEKPVKYRVAVFPDAGSTPVRFTAAIESSPAKVIAASPIGRSRPLLIVVDPNSYGRMDIRRSVAALGRAIAARAAAGGQVPAVRVGLPLLDGIVTPALTNPRTLVADLDAAIVSYLSDNPSERATAGGILDLALAVAQKAESEDGPVDCLLLFRDRAFEGPDSDYLNAGMERAFLAFCAARGSTLHAVVEGSGILARICEASGGSVFAPGDPPEKVVDRIAADSARGFLVEIEGVTVGYGGPLSLDLRAGGVQIRAPKRLWRHPDAGGPPNHHRMRQGLDWLRRAGEGIADGNLTRALRSAESALSEDPWNPEAYLLTGASARDGGDLHLAVTQMTRALEAVAPDARVLELYGTVMRRSGRAAEAATRIRALLGRSVTESPALRLERARLEAAAGRDASARELMASLVERTPGDAALGAEHGELLERVGDRAGAQKQFESVLAASPDNATALGFFARAAAARGEVERAIELARRAAGANARNAMAHSTLGRILFGAGDWKGAAESFRISLALDPEQREVRDLQAEALTRGGQEGDAIALMRRALEANPSDIAAVRKLADIQARSGSLGDAVATLENGAAHQGPDSYLLYRNAAELRERRGEYGQALLDYRAMLRAARPESTAALRSELAGHLASLSLLVGGKRAKGLPIHEYFLSDDAASPSTELAPKKAEASGGGGEPAVKTAERSAEKAPAPGGIPVPGGITLLARTVGIEADVLKEPDALERMMSYILEANPQQNDRLQDNAIRRDTVACLRQYDALLEHLRKRKLLPPDFDPRRGQELVFPLVGGADTLKATQQFLSFFGVGIKTKKAPDGSFAVTLTLKQNRSSSPRQQMLRNMGVNLLDSKMHEVRVWIGEESLPILLGPEIWTHSILTRDRGKWRTLLERFLIEARAMRLYLALAGTSEASRNGLVKAAAGELLDLADALAGFGRHLDFHDGELVFPGQRASWESLLGIQPSSPGAVAALLRRDQGRALLLYSALSAAPRPVQDYLTATPQRLQNVYQMLASYGTSRANESGAARFDLGRVLRQLRADARGLLLDIDRRFARFFLSGAQQDSGAAAAQGPLRIDEGLLPRFIEPNAPTSVLSFSVLELVEFLKYLQSVHPEMLDDAAAQAIMLEPGSVPALVDLVVDLAPPPAMLVRYLSFCREVGSQGTRGWNANRMRTVQSLVHLLALLARQGAIDENEGRRLLGVALDRMNAPDEGAFGHAVAAFVSGELLPALTAKHPAEPGSEVLLEALAGRSGTREFAFEGRRLQFDPAAYKLQRMKATIERQRFTPLPDLLEAYRLLAELQKAPDDTVAITALRKAIGVIRPAEAAMKGTAKTNNKAIAEVNLAALEARIEAAARGKGGARQLAPEIASALHVELGVTLLTYCYGYYGAPEADVLAFDSNFVRKHDFFGSQTKDGGWPITRLEQTEGVGSYCIGSISGLGFELSRLETAQSVQNFGRREGRGLVPTILSGMRLMRRSERSDRAQEYVALSVRLAREILAFSTIDPSLGRWCERYLANRIPPRRREQVLRLTAEGSPQRAAEVLSPSELFLLAESYRADAAEPEAHTAAASDDAGTQAAAASGGGSGGNGHSTISPAQTPGAAPRFATPLLARLAAIAPPEHSPQARGFRREVDQYGVLLRKRLGLSRLSLEISDSYEQLERSVREEVLYERICDLKIRMAELNYALGIPAFLGEVEGELAIRDILPQSAAVRTDSWRLALEQIGRLEPEHARNWVEELLNRGILAVPQTAAADRAAGTQP